MKPFAGLVAIAFCVCNADAADWSRFRGPNGSGVAEEKSIPTEWSDTRNLAWKVALPGPGSSSPIIVGDRLFLTSYSGYGVDAENPGSIKDLQRHLQCFDAKTGKQLWEAKVAGVEQEDPYRGFITEHGYASSSPVSDGEHVYVFFGKAGVVAYDMQGKQLWQTSVGTESGPQQWGSGASPILHENLVIVNASEESQSLVALDKITGKQVWKAAAEGIGSTWGTPIILGEGDKAEIVIGVPYEIWGLNPKTGKLKWFANALEERSYNSSVVSDGRVIYAIEGQGGNAIAIRAGGKDDISQYSTVWRGRASGRTSSPLLYDGRLYTTNRGVVQCLDAVTGEQIYQARIPQTTSANPGSERPNDGPRPGGPGGFGGGRGGRGGGGQDYSSPIVVDGKIYLMTRSGLTHVWQSGPEFQLIAQNRFESDSSRYNATPAVANGRMYLRSDKTLFCVAAADKP